MYQGILVMWKDEDRKYMDMALELARKGLGKVNPNPLVGAVIVKDGRVIAEGWHKECGSLHAETDALASCTEDPAGAAMYVTLEPCCHFGKQPPCTSAIIKAGIAKVIIAMTDPNPLVAGRGIKILEENGIEVRTGLFEDRARYLNRVFIKFITERRPWVVMKYAMTMDGHIAAASGDSRWVSCGESRRMVHEMRGRYMGIMAGKGTVETDDPMLNCRTEGMRQPVRIIADSHASLSCSSAIARTSKEYRTILAHTDAAPAERLDALKSCGVQTVECSHDQDGKVDMLDLTGKLGSMGIDSVLLEGGAGLNWSMVRDGLVDEYYIFVAPGIIGGEQAKCPVGGSGFLKMSDAVRMEVESVTRCGTDWLFHGFKESRVNEY